eukprot:TRINITY_DN38967_c0_g1_i1.p1 TRINITY_DN38967_c0_g1~~TRINITY_DN38967_c0_g1_i1.p1  ORF type:complete len:418 (+),score=131.74 TRINITY_DN38967_c0_g1_i1:69-1256(+)
MPPPGYSAAEVEDALLQLTAGCSRRPAAAAAPQRQCANCGRVMTPANFAKHEPHCGRPFRDRASHNLRAEGRGGGSVLDLLARLLSAPLGRPLGLGDLHERFAEAVLPAAARLGAAAVPVAPPDALPKAVQEAMLERAAAAGCRTADREAKHHAQEVALCGAICAKLRSAYPELWARWQRAGTAAPDVCLIDVGAAAGELLHMLQAALRTTVVLVEFYRPPRMVDELYEGDPNFRRIWKRVEDVAPEDLRPMARRINIVVAKHLCGDGSCHAMTQVVTGWRRFIPVSHLFLVPCCQQMSTWAGYCGRPYLCRLGMEEGDFEHIRCKTGWKSLQHRDARNRHRTLYDAATLLETLWHRGRADFLLRSGASGVELSQFVAEEVTVKNVLLVADWPLS